ncbi:hypothetical protein PMI33_03132 [Pseudomonas sp. GM67]|jgi:hypothetical protein|nr:hypothetical protein PMI33_03132 [Pseudomonas sp. GM67]
MHADFVGAGLLAMEGQSTSMLLTYHRQQAGSYKVCA